MNLKNDKYKMRLWEVFLIERKMDIIDALSNYKDNPTMFISFVEERKIGINPKSRFDTPLGIYAYPLKEIWEDLIQNSIPFASDRPFVYLLKCVDSNVQEISEYTPQQYTNDLESLKRKYSEYFQQKKMVFEEKIEFWEATANIQTPAGHLWNITRNLAILSGKRSSVIWNSILRDLGYAGFTDKKGVGLIHGYEPIQAVFFSIKPITSVGIFDNVRLEKVNPFANGKMNIQHIYQFSDYMSGEYEGEGVKPRYLIQIEKLIRKEWEELLIYGQSKHFDASKFALNNISSIDKQHWEEYAEILGAAVYRNYDNLEKVWDLIGKYDILQYPELIRHVFSASKPSADTLLQWKPFLKIMTRPETLKLISLGKMNHSAVITVILYCVIEYFVSSSYFDPFDVIYAEVKTELNDVWDFMATIMPENKMVKIITNRIKNTLY